MSSSKGEFTFRKGLYFIPLQAINLRADEYNIIQPVPEMYYTEGNPMPIFLEDDGSNTKSNKPLDDMITERAIEESSEPSWRGFEIIEEYLRSPPKLFLLVFIVIILIAFFSGLGG